MSKSINEVKDMVGRSRAVMTIICGVPTSEVAMPCGQRSVELTLAVTFCMHNLKQCDLIGRMCPARIMHQQQVHMIM